MKKSIPASCPFPIIKLKVNIKYAAVKKPSGVEYIILVLIKDAKNRKEKICDVLKQFGVPDDLLFIFAEGIGRLLKHEILQMEQDIRYYPENFNEYEIAHFEFTDSGNSIFRDGFIPTGEENIKSIILYFNPLTSKFSFEEPKKSRHLEDSQCYSEDFMTQIGTDLPGRDDYLIENLKQTGLQKEERPLGSTVEWQDYLITTETFELLIDNNGMEVNFKTAYVKAFYEKYFTPEMLECELAAQSAFEFKVPVHSIDEFSEFKNLSNVYLPEEYKKQIARPANLLITREEENIFSSAVNAIFPHWSFIAIDKNEMRFCTAAKVKITERVLDKPVNINLLVEQSYGIEQKQAIFDKCESFLNEKNNTEKVEILLEANKVPSDSEWKLIAENCANKIYGELISELTKENVEFFAKIAKKLDNIRKLEKDVLLNDVSNKLSSEITDEVELFNFLLKAGFNENESLSVANVIKNYVKKALAGVSELEKSPISDKFSSLANCLKNLKENTLRDDKFIADFKAYKSSLSNLKKYEGFAPDEFKELFDYKETMQAEFESLMAKRNSSQNPGKVNKESIRNKIDVGEYRAAVIEMAIPLEYVLGKLLKIEKNNDNKLVKTINIARDKRILTEEQAQTLHEFRQIRNQLLHSTQAQPKLDREKVSKWADVIFKITEKPEDKK